MHLDCHADQWLGLRENQEDCVLVETLIGKTGNPRYLLLVADGMGGHAAGEVASRLVVDDMLKSVKSANRDANIEPVLRKALQDANDILAAAIEENIDYSGMGTTLVAVVVDDKNVCWISVGDSLFYLV
ncbi:MAG: protein phosphatase 2C domain-containing protein, partial [Sneathiella sp.]